MTESTTPTTDKDQPSGRGQIERFGQAPEKDQIPSDSAFVNFFRAIRTNTQKLVATIRAWALSAWAQQYNPSQWCYFTAGILFIMGLLADEGNGYGTLAGWVAFFGLVRELLHLFHRIWDTTLGKGAILILYASTANVALAYAAMKINLISGVEPTPFTFTLGFTTLVLMPFWLTLSTVLVFLVFLIVVNLWLLVRLPIKMIGFDIQLHWEDKKRAVLTMFLRIALIPLAVVSILEATKPYFVDFFGDPTDNIFTTQEFRKQLQEGIADAADADTSLEEQPIAEVTVDVQPDDEDRADAIQRGLIIDKWIAHFIWYLEAYPNSFCEKPQEVRTIPIEEGVVLFVYKDNEQDVGYRYEVAQCQLRSEVIATDQ
ncbi:MAG: hypothetical protein AAGJ37_13745 [Pseudomonadota bacterium]